MPNESFLRKDFDEETWLRSCECQKEIAVHLAGASDVPFESSPFLPVSHASALAMVTRLSARCQEVDAGTAAGAPRVEPNGVPSGLRSCIKYCVKKNGLGKASAHVSPAVIAEVSWWRINRVAVERSLVTATQSEIVS